MADVSIEIEDDCAFCVCELDECNDKTSELTVLGFVDVLTRSMIVALDERLMASDEILLELVLLSVPMKVFVIVEVVMIPWLIVVELPYSGVICEV